MLKLVLVCILSVVYSFSPGQTVLLFKKNSKTVETYWEGSFIAFQLDNREWRKGEIMKISTDSIYIRPMVIQYHLYGADTIRYIPRGYALTDVYALPKKGVLVDYKDDKFQIVRSGGHVHWYWIKSGWIFRVGAVGYTGLHVLNGVLNNSFSLQESKTKLLAAGAVFIFGMVLKYTYNPTIRVDKKFHLETLALKNH